MVRCLSVALFLSPHVVQGHWLPATRPASQLMPHSSPPRHSSRREVLGGSALLGWQLLGAPAPALAGPPAVSEGVSLDYATKAEIAAERKRSEANSKLVDKQAKKIFDAGVDFANRGSDPETQKIDAILLRKAEDRFTILTDEVAPNFIGGYTNRANVRVVLNNLDGALADYEKAIELAPLASDVWVTRLNRGSTLLALGRDDAALAELELAVKSSKGDGVAVLQRGAALHQLGRYEEAAKDYGQVVEKNGLDIQPYWLRYALELFAVGRRQEALGIARRVANKFDLEPEVVLAVSAMLWENGGDSETTEALERWRVTPKAIKQKAAVLPGSETLKARQWPPQAEKAAAVFLQALPPALRVAQ